MTTLDVAQCMMKLARAINARFSLNGRPLTMEEVFAPTGLLPGMAKRADQLSSLCMGYGIGASFEEAEGAVLGVKVIFDDITPHVLRVFFLFDIMSELVRFAPRGEPAPLDQLLYD